MMARLNRIPMVADRNHGCRLPVRVVKMDGRGSTGSWYRP